MLAQSQMVLSEVQLASGNKSPGWSIAGCAYWVVQCAGATAAVLMALAGWAFEGSGRQCCEGNLTVSDLAMAAALFRSMHTRGRVRRALRRLSVGLLAVVMVIALAPSAFASVSARSSAPDRAGTGAVVHPMSAPAVGGGSFVPLQARLADTRGASPLAASAWTSYQVNGMVGIPSSGVSAVVVAVTALPSSAPGNLQLGSDTSRPAAGATSFLNFDAAETISNTGMVGVGSNGKIAIYSSSTAALNVLIDVQGYFTASSGQGGGGFMPVTGTRIVDTRGGGTALPQGALANGSVSRIQVSGAVAPVNSGVPASANAAVINITAINTGTAPGWTTAYPTGSPQPSTSMNFPGSSTTAQTVTVDLDSQGRFNLFVGAGGPVNVLIDVQGYFDGQALNSGFTPTQGRVFDSRVSPNVALAPNSVTAIPLSGQAGVPAAGPTLAGVAVNIVMVGSSGAGALRLWSTSDPEPSTSNINMDNSAQQSNFAVLKPGVSDGKVYVRNVSNRTVTLIVDVEGYFVTANQLPPAYGPSSTSSGDRVDDQLWTHTLTDRSGVAVSPVNGNLVYTQKLLSMAGIGISSSVMLRYNSLNDARPTLSQGLFETALFRKADGSLSYVAPDGGQYTFFNQDSTYAGVNATGAAATLTRFGGSVPTGPQSWKTDPSPYGINASLVRVAGDARGAEYDLTFHPSQTMNVYHDDGTTVRLDSTQDVTGSNKITYNYTGGLLTSQTDTQGRSVTYAYTDPNNPLQPSSITDTSLGRTIALTYAGPSGALSKVVDATGVNTQFSYNTAGKMSKIIDGSNIETDLGYNPSNQFTTLHLAAGAGAAAGETSWAFTYSSLTPGSGMCPTTATSCSTIVDPNSHSWTYALKTVGTNTDTIQILDPNGHGTGASWSAHGEITSATSQLSDTTSYGYADSTYNLTSITAPNVGKGGAGGPGRSTQFSYTTSPSGGNGTYYTTDDFRPQYETDANTNKTTFTYNKWGEAKVTTTAVASVATTSSITRQDHQSDETGTSCGGKPGQLCKKTMPTGGVSTYAYDSAGNVSTITPPAPLGVKTFTHDAAGRVTSVVDGRGTTTWTCYDGNDRTVQVSTTSSSCSTKSGVSNSYDPDGNLTTRQTQATGIVTTITYDQQNRPTQKSESNGTTSVTYDAVGNVLTYSDPAGKTSYGYDLANRLSTLALPGGSCPPGVATPNSTKCVTFNNDVDNRRIETRFPSGVSNHSSYDASGRIEEITATNSAGTLLADRRYTHATAAGQDASLITKIADDTGTAGSVTYTYDGMNRLLTATPTAGTSYSYSYDADGNRIKQIAGATSTYYGYNTADQLCWTATSNTTGCNTPYQGTSYTYDANGNNTGDTAGNGTTNTWTGFNQLANVTAAGNGSYGGNTEDFTYAGTTNTQRVSAGGTTFTNGILGAVSRTTGGPTANYIHDPSGNLIAMQYNGHDYYYTGDIINSTILLTDETQTVAAKYDYDPYGATLTATGSVAAANPYRYAAGWTDTQTGLIKFGARYYDSKLGRFNQPDPSGQEPNRYTYAAESPISNMDPTGLDSQTVTGTACFLFICGSAGVTTDSDGNAHFHVGLGGSSSFAGANVTETVSTGDGGQGLEAYANASAGGYTGGGSLGQDGFSGHGGGQQGTGDLLPEAEIGLDYTF